MEARKAFDEGAPLLFGGESDAKRLIVRVLSKKHPLSAHKIFLEIRHAYPVELTYQGVHKAIKQLVEQSVVVEKDKAYSISTSWILGLKKQGEQLEQSYFPNKPHSLVELKEGESFNEVIRGPVNVGYYCLIEFNKVLHKGSSLVGRWSWCWPGTVVTPDKFKLVKRMITAGETYFACSKDRFMD